MTQAVPTLAFKIKLQLPDYAKQNRIVCSLHTTPTVNSSGCPAYYQMLRSQLQEEVCTASPEGEDALLSIDSHYSMLNK